MERSRRLIPTAQALGSPILRAAIIIKSRLASDPTLASDEMRLAAIITEELRTSSRIASIPSSLRDDA